MNNEDPECGEDFSCLAVAKSSTFFTFHQNNSGGDFIVDGDVSYYVVVEAHNAEEANERAEKIGIYFDGCADGTDCPCCGDRWGRAWKNEGTNTPQIDGEIVSQKSPGVFSRIEGIFCYVYYLDGTITEHHNNERMI